MMYAEEWLTELLCCGIDDLEVFKNCKYPCSEIVEMLYERAAPPTLENIVELIVEIGQDKLSRAIDNEKDAIVLRVGANFLQSEEYKALDKLNPRLDIVLNFNFLCSTVDIESNREIYERYLKAECEKFEDDTGFLILPSSKGEN